MNKNEDGRHHNGTLADRWQLAQQYGWLADGGEISGVFKTGSSGATTGPRKKQFVRSQVALVRRASSPSRENRRI